MSPPVLMVRWHGWLQQVNRVTGATVLPALQERWPDIRTRQSQPGRTYPTPCTTLDLISLCRMSLVGTSTVPDAHGVLLDQLLSQPSIRDTEVASKEVQDAALD